MSTNPTDAQGNAILGNTSRLTEVAAQFHAAHGALNGVPRTLEDYIKLMSLGDDIPRTVTGMSTSGCDSDIYWAVFNAAPRTYWGDHEGMTAVRSLKRAREKAELYATTIGGFANQLRAADIEVSAELTSIAPTLLVTYSALDRFEHRTAAAYRDANHELEDADMLDESGNLNPELMHDGLNAFFGGMAPAYSIMEAADGIGRAFGADGKFRWARPANVTDLLAEFAVECGDESVGSANDSGGSDLPIVGPIADWLQRGVSEQFHDARDLVGGASSYVWDQGGNALDFVGSQIASGADFGWDSVWNVGKFGANSVGDILSAGGDGASNFLDLITGDLTPGEFMRESWDNQMEMFGDVGSNFREYAGDQFDNLKDLGSSVYDNGREFVGETIDNAGDLAEDVGDFLVPDWLT